MSVKLGVALAISSATAEQFWQWVDCCEREGIDSVWIADRLVGSAPSLEPIATCAALAGRTRRLKFGPSVLVLPLRSPVILAKEVATIDFLSAGRMLLAVGVGGDDPREWVASGVPVSERGARTDEAIALLRRLWTEERVSFHGRFFQCADVTLTPRPVQQPVPLWVGGHSEAALRRTALLGDGWLPSFLTPEQFAAGRRQIVRLAAEAGRAIEEDHYGVFLLFHLAPTREQARAVASHHLQLPARIRHPSLDQPYILVGTVEDVCAGIARYLEAGARKFVLRPVGPPEAIEEQLLALAREVIPQVAVSGVAG
ncbi:MAG: LLM class F420-dependent oxidoreductase [Dehalococcoidia bacterium]|nr:MAG: LLM class F420-dependent oxidoreductase [Dehalococcoidia bacterium]